MSLGTLDFAGGTVVEINCGLSALALAIVLGTRREKVLLPHNLGYSVLGAGFLFFGWLGFNGGSALVAGGISSNAILVTVISACIALIAWCVIDTIKIGKPTVLGAITGLIAGLVAITPAAGFVDVLSSIIIGIVASCVSYFAIYYVKEKLGYDDALDVFGVHGCSGMWGVIATGIFASPFINPLGKGLLYGNPGQLGIQALAVCVSVIYVFAVSYAIAKVLDKTIGIRVEERIEVEGLDTNLHEESGYNI
jgi:Amt family ammonium transporter